MKKLSVNVIYTFDTIGQKFKDIDLPEIMLRDKETFFIYLTTSLNEKQKKLLCKISCCIHGDIVLPSDSFYISCNGKYWDIEIIYYMGKHWGIQSTVKPINTKEDFPEIFAATVPPTQ